jgi:hypothetical protein
MGLAAGCAVGVGAPAKPGLPLELPEIVFKEFPGKKEAVQHPFYQVLHRPG